MICTLCPRECRAERTETRAGGVCGQPSAPVVAKAMLHQWEEPCLVGTHGAGCVFFSGCNLRCCFCQNGILSREGFGKPITVERLRQIFRELIDQGAACLDLVTPTQFTPAILEALGDEKWPVPVVWNCGGYEKADTSRLLDGKVQVYLPDFKYALPDAARRYSGAADYFDRSTEAILEMYRQTGPYVLENGLLKRGVLIRHLLLPGCRKDSMAVLEALSHLVPPKRILLSLMSQYTPCYRAAAYKEIDRRVTDFEIDSVRDYAVQLGFEGYGQARSAASAGYTPAFDLTGV